MIDERTEKQKEIDERYKRRVLAGIAKLEDKYGPNWVELGEEQWKELFDIQDSTACVLGGVGRGKQLGGYHDMLRELEISSTLDSHNLGFTVMSEMLDEEDDETEIWRSLQRLWTKELRERGVRVYDGMRE